MKHPPLVIFFFLAMQICFAQVVIEENPSYTNPANKPFFDDWFAVDVLDGTSAAGEIHANTHDICFDKVLKVKSTFPGTTAGTCLFINTKIGLVANTPVKEGSVANCDISPQRDDFVLFILGLKGNTFNYFNSKKNGVLQHNVSTGNSETYRYQFANNYEVVTLYRTPNVKEYFGKVKAWEYKADGREERWYLFGKTVPVKIEMAASKFLGNYGVGFHYTDQGQFIIMEVTSPTYNSEIIALENKYVCFNPTPFKFLEEQNFTLGMNKINSNREKVRKKLDALNPNDCPDLHQKKYIFQLKAYDRQEQQLILSRQGNVQQSIATQSAMLQLESYDDAIQESIYDTEISICRVQRRIERSRSGATASDQERLQCLQRQKAEQHMAQQNMQAIRTQYPNNPAKQLLEKQKLLLAMALKLCK